MEQKNQRTKGYGKNIIVLLMALATIGFGLLIIYDGGSIPVIGYAISERHDNKEAGCTKTSIRFPIPMIEAGQTPFYTAYEKGYYDDECLDVEFTHGSAELNPVKMVVTKTDDFGLLSGPDTLLVARGRGQPIKAVAIFHKDANFLTILTMKDSGLTTVKDLDGKKIGMFMGHISVDILHTLFRQEGVELKEVGVTYYDYSQMISGRLDAGVGFRQTALPNLDAEGIEVNTIDPQDYGVKSHGYTLFAREDYIQENPEVVKKFLRATLKGLQYSVNHPEESVGYLVKQDPKLDRDRELGRLPVYNIVTSTKPYGYMDYEMFSETYDRLIKEKVINKGYDVRNAYDTRFIKELNIHD